MAKSGTPAKLIFKEKLVINGGLMRDGVIWKVPRSDRYPLGIRYRLALIGVKTSQIVSLFDNHYPKGPHRHMADGSEEPYEFDSVEKLIRDYLSVVRQEERRREN